MNSVFDNLSNQALRQRVAQLSPTSQPLWGKMTVNQMLAHLQKPTSVALGAAKMKRSLLGRLFGRLVKKQMLGGAPFKQNLPTDKQLLVAEPADFSREQAGLLAQLVTLSHGAAEISTNPHPFFGHLTPPEWDVLIAQHIDHHLRQFGV